MNTTCFYWEPRDTYKPSVTGKPRPCIVYTGDTELTRYQIATYHVGRGWVNQFSQTVYNVTFFAYITQPGG